MTGERSPARQRRGWLEKWIDHLGRISDYELARRAGVSRNTVFLERQARGIAPRQVHAAPVDWTPEKLALIGTASDSRIARILGVGKDVVSRKRKLLGIPSFHPPGRNLGNPPYPWTPEGLAQLGQRSDQQVAESLGISKTVVQMKRQELGIPSCKPLRRFQWTAKMLDQLGKVHDRVLAERLGLSPGTVYKKRLRLGIPPCRRTRSNRRLPELGRQLLGSVETRSTASTVERDILETTTSLERTPARKRFDWPKELVALLGRIPDQELARRAGVAHTTVATERQRRGIDACHAKRDPISWTPEMIDRLGTASDREVAEELGIALSSVARKRSLLGIPPFHPPTHVNVGIAKWTPRNLALLGKVTDKQLARRMRVSATTVCRKRQQLGIPPSKPPAPSIQWSEEMLALLGKVPDAAVARRHGISAIRVFWKRAELGIPPYLNTHSVVRTPELIALLRLPAREVERQTDLHRSTIVRLQRELGIEAGPPSRKRRRRSTRRRSSR